MRVENLNLEFPLILIDNYYNQEELDLIWEELNFLGSKNKLHLGDDPRSGSAVDKDSNPLKNNYSVSIDSLFAYDRNFSNILKVNRKLFNEWDSIIRQNNHWFYKNLKCENDFTFLSYYENNNYYNLHQDDSFVTVLSWFYKEPKKFKGGDLIFENGQKIRVLNNRTVIFPSMIKHGVESIIMEEVDLDKKMGRFCITQFLAFYL